MNYKRIFSRKVALAVLLIALVTTSLASAWLYEVTLTRSTDMPSNKLSGYTSYTIAMDLPGTYVGLPGDNYMKTTLYKDDGLLWDTEIASWTDKYEYSHNPSSLDPSETYYVTWEITGDDRLTMPGTYLKFY
jgi:hypothetical protein